MGEHREFIGSYEKMGDGVWSIDDQIADTSQEVVRCKDCTHWTEDEAEYYHYCGEWCGQVEPDGFCKWGERRDD